MEKTTNVENEARKLCTHTVVFTNPMEKMVAVRAMQGRSTKAIAQEFKITVSRAQYRVTKAQAVLGTYFRADYRNGTGAVVKKMMRATQEIGLKVVEQQIAPKFIPFARPGISRVS